MILRNHFIINLILFILVILLGIKAFSVMNRSAEIPVMPESVELVPENISITPKAGFVAETAYSVVSEKNIFTPSRTLKSGIAEAAPVKISPKDAPKLFGTIIIGSRRSALLKDPATNSTKNYYIDDAVGDFVVKDIQESSVELTRGDEVIEIKLREAKGVDPAERSRRQRVKPAPRLQKKPPQPRKNDPQNP